MGSERSQEPGDAVPCEVVFGGWIFFLSTMGSCLYKFPGTNIKKITTNLVIGM
jgi:hypothetical protein